MNRRELLAAVAAIGLAPGARALAAAGDLRAAAREAWIYVLPLIEMASARARMLNPAGAGQPAAINSFRHGRALTGPQNRTITTPNNDTLYSSAWLDLTKGPVTLVIPPTGSRYISVAALDMYTDNDAILGTRTLGGEGGRYTLVGPGQPGLGPNIVRIATPHAWMLARVLVDGPEDLAAAHKVQDGLLLQGPAGPPLAAYATRQSPWSDYFASAQQLLLSDPPPATDGAEFRRIAPLSLAARGGFQPGRFDAAAAREIEAGIAEAKAAIRAGQAANLVQGWTYPRTNLGDFGQDYLFRAAVALGGLAALTPVEAMYLRPVAEDGRSPIFTGDGPYRLSFAAGQLPPVDGFWSLTMYEATPDGQFFLTPNPIDRYAIGDRTRGLKTNPDGSLDIWIGRSDPGDGRSANWLPARAKGPFSMTLRTYLPRTDLLDGRYRLPPVTRA